MPTKLPPYCAANRFPTRVKRDSFPPLCEPRASRVPVKDIFNAPPPCMTRSASAPAPASRRMVPAHPTPLTSCFKHAMSLTAKTKRGVTFTSHARHVEPTGLKHWARARTEDGGVPPARIARLNDQPRPTSAQMLGRFMAEGGAGGQFSRSDMLQFWTAAFAMETMLHSLSASEYGCDLLDRAADALDHVAMHGGSRAGPALEPGERLVSLQVPTVPGAVELQRVIEASVRGVGV